MIYIYIAVEGDFKAFQTHMQLIHVHYNLHDIVPCKIYLYNTQNKFSDELLFNEH